MNIGDTKLTFGKYSGKKLSSVPVGYKIWLAKQDFVSKQIKEYCSNISKVWLNKNPNKIKLQAKNHGKF